MAAKPVVVCCCTQLSSTERKSSGKEIFCPSGKPEESPKTSQLLLTGKGWLDPQYQIKAASTPCLPTSGALQKPAQLGALGCTL